MKYSRPLSNLTERLRSAKTYGGRCALFMGGGCSVSAGVPTLDGCVKILEQEYPQAFGHMKHKSFDVCMNALSLNDRMNAMALFLDGARLNWTHICVAMLIKEGYLQRVLTTNFDPLLARACALLGVHPTVYDPVQLEKLDPALINEPAVFHLRGRGSSLLLLTSEEEAKRHRERVAPAFANASSRYTWIVVGYGGKGDPEYTQLAGVKQYEKELYWVMEQKEPPEHIKQDLLRLGKGAFCVGEHTPDDFFLALTKSLDLFPPYFLTNPFSFLLATLKALVPFTATGQRADEANRAFETPMAWVEQAIARYEMGGEDEEELPATEAAGPAEAERPSAPAAQAAKPAPKRAVEGPPAPEVIAKVRSLFESQQFRQVIEELGPYQRPDLDSDTTYLLSRAHMMNGNALLGAAKKRSRREAVPLLEDAVDNYKEAVELNPGCYQSLNNWGYALKFQAELHDGPKADKLLKQAIDKYEQAVKVKPDSHQVLNNWGHALKMRADRHEGQEAENLLKEAITKYQAALAIKDDDFTALHNWGNALLAQADKVGGSEGDRLRTEGMKKMKAAQAVMLLRT